MAKPNAVVKATFERFGPGDRTRALVDAQQMRTAVRALGCWQIILLCVAALLILLMSTASAPAMERAPHLVCDQVAERVARETGVPVSVMKSITRAETGRNRDGRLTPWPWTVNMEGAGKWFDTRRAAEVYVTEHFASGARSFDVGCFQINYKWHGQAFASANAMFEPMANARYAAKFLSELHAELGDWSKAAGAYHSRTPQYAERYRTRFDRIRARLAKSDTDTVTPNLLHTSRVNSYPLLQTGAQATGLGSLVPLDAAGHGSLFSMEGN